MLLLYEPFIITKVFFDWGKMVLAYRILDKNVVYAVASVLDENQRMH